MKMSEFPELVKIVENFFTNPNISTKSQVIQSIKGRFPDLNDEQINRLLTTVINIYKNKLKVLMSNSRGNLQ